MKNSLMILAVTGFLCSAAAAAPAPVKPPVRRTTVVAPAAPIDRYAAHVGFAIPLIGDLQDVANAGFQLGGEWLHRVSPVTSCGVGVDSIVYGGKTHEGLHYETDMISVLGLMRRELGSTAESQPYWLAGIGLTHTEIEIADASRGDDASTTFLIGGGIDVRLSNGAVLGVVGRYQHFLVNLGDVEGGGAIQILGQLRW